MHDATFEVDAGRKLSCEARQVIASSPDAVQQLYLWYSGFYMGETAPINGPLHRALQGIASTYGDKVEVPERLYRLDRGDLPLNATTPKPIVSWSRDKDAAYHFYKVFTMGVNRVGTSAYDWRIISATNNKPLCTFESTIAFLRDACKELYAWVNDPDMHGSKEVICETPATLEGFRVEQALPSIPIGEQEGVILRQNYIAEMLGLKEAPLPAWGT